MKRRQVLVSGLAAGLAASGCSEVAPPPPHCRWVQAPEQRGHRLRATPSPQPLSQEGRGASSGAQLSVPVRRAEVLVLGGGIAGLSALRQLVRQGVDDAQLLELADGVGGNSQGHQLGGMACPQGAHYLPVPGEAAGEVRQWLEEIGLLRLHAGVLRPDERQLCHAPQERLFIDGAWQDGLLPSAEGRPATLAQYRRFAALARAQRQALAFSLPTHASPWTPDHSALDAQSFAAWLHTQGLDDARLLAYLDYCCRDDYGAGLTEVSAWAGLHYFNSRHGFHAPGEADAEREPVFTWPEGNARLVTQLADPLRERLHTGRSVLRVQERRQHVEVLAWDEARQQPERWQARAVVLAVPLFIAARLLADWPDPLRDALRSAATRQPHAPWLVANLHLTEPLLARPGTPPAWDNVRFSPAGQAGALGYVDAMHQQFRPHPGPTVLTAYHPLPVAQRPALLAGSAAHWGAQVLAELAQLHPDAPHKVRAIDLTRWGHAMAIPVPGVRASAWLTALRTAGGRVRFAHSDLAGYSVFEEAFTLGVQAARGLGRS